MTYPAMTTTVAEEAATPTISRPPAVAPLWVLALITLSGTLAMHIFVPALPMAAADLGVTSGVIQLTLTAYIVGLAIGQLTYGPLSDRYGRKPVLLVGTVIYLIASLAAYLAPDIRWLLAARFFQAIGGCSGLVLGRAIVRDNAAGNEAAKRLSLMNLMTMAGPGLSPLLGALVVGMTGWRSIFAVVCLLGVANLVLIWFLLPRTPGTGGQDMRIVMIRYGRLLKSVQFLGFTIGGGFTTTAIYSFIAAAPFIFSGELHQAPEKIGIYLAINIGGIWLGSLTTSWLIGRLSAAQIMIFGTTVSFLSALTFAGFVFSGNLGLVSTILTMLVFSYGAGAASPVALAEAMNINPSMAGSASGLYGFTQMMVGAACSALSGIGRDPAMAVAIILVSAGIISQASFWTAQAIGKRTA